MTELIDESNIADGEAGTKQLPTGISIRNVGGSGDNNNDNDLVNNNLPEDGDAVADVVSDLKSTSVTATVASQSAEQSAGTAVDHRVSNWLAKNRQFQQSGANEDDDEIDENDSGRHSDSNLAQAIDANENNSAERQQKVKQRSIVRGASPVPGDEDDIVHQFLIPNRLGGSMVGTGGRNISYIRSKSGASVWISRNFFDKKTQVVNIRGPVDCVKSALQVIKKRFPELDVKPINTAVPIQRNPALQPIMVQLSLPVGATIDVTVSAMSRGTTVFLQQPTHPSFHHLEKMDALIKRHYGGSAVGGSNSQPPPCLPRPVNPGAVCIAPFGDSWHRAIIADVFPEEDAVLMKYLDWGGYEKMPVGCLKQIRTEMMHLPFQAVEAHLAYVSPALQLAANSGPSAADDVDSQLDTISRAVHQGYLTGRRVKCQVMYFNDVGQPCVYLYARDQLTGNDSQQPPWRFVQEELVEACLMHWFHMPRAAPQLPQTQQQQQRPSAAPTANANR